MDKSKAKRGIISTDDTPAKKKRRNEKKKTTKKSEKDIKMMIQRHLMEKTMHLAFFVMNCFQNPNQRKGGIICTRCNGWAHEHCAGIAEQDDDITYTCDFCN
jgi:hypothetical protein